MFIFFLLIIADFKKFWTLILRKRSAGIVTSWLWEELDISDVGSYQANYDGENLLEQLSHFGLKVMFMIKWKKNRQWN